MHKKIQKKNLEKHFIVEKEGGLFRLNYSNLTKPIFIKLPFCLNEDIASLLGLMPNGSLIKDLRRIYFSQKKDQNKIELFDTLIKKLFSKEILLFRKTDNRKCKQVYVNSKTLALFFYYILDTPKSDEKMKVPDWIFNSPTKVKIAYLKQAFDMEGTILKSLKEIRFVSKSNVLVNGVQRLLMDLGITSHITYTPRPTQKSGQYRLSIYRKENFEKFKKIGFRIHFLKERFQALISKYQIY